jgi:hypothetical protein
MPVVDGLLLTTTRMSDSSVLTAAKETPLVVLNREVAGVPSVISDNTGGGRRAVEHLRDLGHSGLTYVAGPPASWADGMRWRSIYDTASVSGLRVRQLGPFTPTVEGGAYAAQAFLDDPTTSHLLQRPARHRSDPRAAATGGQGSGRRQRGGLRQHHDRRARDARSHDGRHAPRRHGVGRRPAAPGPHRRDTQPRNQSRRAAEPPRPP